MRFSVHEGENSFWKWSQQWRKLDEREDQGIEAIWAVVQE